MTDNSLKKTERLSGHTCIAQLFDQGISFYHYPFKVMVLTIPTGRPSPVRILVSVSKRIFKKATDRNRIKRIVRECYRLNKQILNSSSNSNDFQIHLALIYTSKEIPLFQQLQPKMVNTLTTIVHKINELNNTRNPTEQHATIEKTAHTETTQKSVNT